MAVTEGVRREIQDQQRGRNAMFTVRIYGYDPQQQREALLEEQHFTVHAEALDFTREAAGDEGVKVTLNGIPVGPYAARHLLGSERREPHMISPYRGRWAIP